MDNIKCSIFIEISGLCCCCCLHQVAHELAHSQCQQVFFAHNNKLLKVFEFFSGDAKTIKVGPQHVLSLDFRDNTYAGVKC